MSEPTDPNDPACFRVVSFLDSDNSRGLEESETPGEGGDGLTEQGVTPMPETDALDVDREESEALTSGFASEEQESVSGKRVALVGRFGSMNHREATNVLNSFQAIVVDLPRPSVGTRAAQGPWDAGLDSPLDWVVIGAAQSPLSQSDLLSADLIERAARGEIEILHETELWQRLGLVDVEQSVRRYHTPAMLADLLGVSVRVIRRWQRRGLITPVVTLHKLPYFDYAEVATAKRLAGWIAAGASPAAIEHRLVDLVQVLPGIRRPLDQLSILVEGKHVLLRQGDGLVEPGGQMRFDFDALEKPVSAGDPEGTGAIESPSREILAFEVPDLPPMLRSVGGFHEDPILVAAYEAEDDDDLETAVELYHTILARDGARADVSFQIGELLYRMNFLVAARERYYSAIEIDPDFVEARASLGAVLAELGQFKLSIAALRGALSMYDDYADVHYTLAKTLDKVGDHPQALLHWQRIIELAPESPWAEEARGRLGN